MNLFLYNIFLSLYALAIRMYGLFNYKAKKWVTGRVGWEQQLKESLKPNEKRVWIHCSSIGEYEQARPVIEAVKEQYPSYKTVVTFFSPSGYEAIKKNHFIDYTFYLPLDGRFNAKKFVEAIDPSMAMFAKYEFWYYYLRELKKRKVPTLLISGAFREKHIFFKWYGGLFRQMLQCFTFFFVQDKKSEEMLGSIGITKNVLVSGDTRYDRVSVIAQNSKPLPFIDDFKAGHKIYIAGSTWPDDEVLLKESLNVLPANWKIIVAPHEVHKEHIQKIRQLFGNDSILCSELDAENSGSDKKILIIDNIGMLSRLFAYGDIAYIGGGFQKGGIHNVLEPAVFGLPVIIGPIYEKFIEAKELAKLKYLFPVNNAEEGNEILNRLINDETYYHALNESLKKFMMERTGATTAIMDYVKKEGWLK